MLWHVQLYLTQKTEVVTVATEGRNCRIFTLKRKRQMSFIGKQTLIYINTMLICGQSVCMFFLLINDMVGI